MLAAQENKKIIIVGAGLTGCCLALFLARRGFDINIYEKRKNFLEINNVTLERTVGMSLSERGCTTLEKLGIKEAVISQSTETYGRISHRDDGSIYKQLYATGRKSGILTIDRLSLNKTLLSELKKYKNVNLYFERNIKNLDFEAKSLEFINNNGKYESISYDYLFGADGVFSPCRVSYENFLNITEQIKPLPIGYIDLRIPFKDCKDFNLQKDFVHVWTYTKSEKAIFVALPSYFHEAFLVNIFCPTEWIKTINLKNNKNEIIDFLSKFFPSIIPILKKIEEESFLGKSSRMFEIECNHWNYKDSFLLMGDSSHAMSPFYAMGMNTCFESCRVFDELLNSCNNNIGDTILQFQNKRKRDTDEMQNFAFENFHSLTQSTKKTYHTHWKINQFMSQLYPSYWKSEYEYISFTNTPFLEVKNKILSQRDAIHNFSFPKCSTSDEFYSLNKDYINKMMGILKQKELK